MPYTADQFSNSAVSTVAGGAGGFGTSLFATDTTLQLASGDGAKFPAAGPFMVALGTLVPPVLYELAKCTSRNGDALTLVRGQEGTVAQLWPVGATVQQVVTAGSLQDIWSHITNLMVNVKDYGAAGTGSVDDTIAIQNAIAAAQTQGGGAVYFPEGTYLISSTLTVNGDNIRLVGESWAAQLKAAVGWATNTPMVAYSATGTPGISRLGVCVEELTLNGNNVAGVLGMDIVGSYGALVRRVHFTAIIGGINLHIDGTSSNFGTAAQVLNCVFDNGNGNATGVQTDFCDWVTITACNFRNFHGNNGTGVKLTNYNCRVIGCQFFNCDTGVQVAFSNSNTITDCDFDSCTNRCIYLQGSAYGLVANNTFGSCTTSVSPIIRVTDANNRNNIIANNVVQSGTTWAYFVQEIGFSSGSGTNLYSQNIPGGLPSSLTSGRTGIGLYNVRDYGALGNGINDDTTAISSAIAAAQSQSGGTVYFPSGYYITGPQTIPSWTRFMGDGQYNTVVQLKNGANADLFSAFPTNVSMAAPAGTSSNSGSYGWQFENMTLDGNKANQTGGTSWPLRAYGYGYTLDNLEVRNGYTGGVQTDYNGAFPVGVNVVFEATWNNVRIHDCYGNGAQMGGPHDSRFHNVVIYIVGSNGLHSAPNNGGLQCSNCHFWYTGHSDAGLTASWLLESTAYVSNSEAEGNWNVQLAILQAGITWTGGSVYSGNSTGLGIMLGMPGGSQPFSGMVRQSGGVSLVCSASSYKIDTLIQNIIHSCGNIWFNSDSGGWIQARAVTSFATPFNVLYAGTIANKTNFSLNAQGYSDSRQQMYITNGQVSYGMSQLSPDPGNGGTIATAGLAITRVNPAGVETGVILQPGTAAGQVVTVINNNAAGTITFAAAATSNVADGAASTIAALTSRTFWWDSGFSRWYRQA